MEEPKIPIRVDIEIGLDTKEGQNLTLTLDVSSIYVPPLPAREIPFENSNEGHDQRLKLQEGVVENYANVIRAHLEREAQLLFSSIVNYEEMKMKGRTDEATRAIVKEHARQTKINLQCTFKVKERGHQRQWDRAQLSEAISYAWTLVSLNDDPRTYDGVAKQMILISQYAAIAPKSGAALKQLVKELDINWMELKK
jgi:hypothetical protein